MTDTPKGYWIANVTITDAEAYKGYQAAAPAAFASCADKKQEGWEEDELFHSGWVLVDKIRGKG